LNTFYKLKIQLAQEEEEEEEEDITRNFLIQAGRLYYFQ
jgi:hypothetical protein